MVIKRESSMFDNMLFYVEYPSSVRYKEKQSVIQLIADNGGAVSMAMTPKCIFIVYSRSQQQSSKATRASKMGLPIASLDFVHDSISAGYLMDMNNYLCGSKVEDFQSGKIPSDPSSDTADFNSKMRLLNPKKIRIDALKPVTNDGFADREYSLLKWALFEWNVSAALSVKTCIEVHSNTSSSVTTFRTAVYHSETVPVLGPPKQYYHFPSLKEASEVYLDLCDRYNGKPKSKRLFKPDPRCCSDQLGKAIVQLSTAFEDDSEPMDPAVEDFINRLWVEAVGEIETCLFRDISDLTLENVTNAESYLEEIKSVLASGISGDEKCSTAWDGFMKALFMRHGCFISDNSKSTKQRLIAAYDFCQLLRDILTVTEASNWCERSPAAAKYSAIGAHIEVVQLHNPIFEHVTKHVPSDGSIEVTDVFAITRHVEGSAFNETVGNIQPLLHGSQMRNGLGILSRGLLLPKVVSDRYGVERWDVGNLGGGIYFSDDFNTSLKYTRSGGEYTGRRLMFLCDVALGQVYDTKQPLPDLNSAPPGFKSVHGCKAPGPTNEEYFFEDDEYAIYSTTQQRIKYAVEFRVVSEPIVDLTRYHQLLNNCVGSVQPASYSVDEYIDVSQIADLPDPMKSTKAGLFGGKSNAEIPLTQLHVRASLVDLAATVTIFQAYKNTGTNEPIEARYVFPIADDAAVTGFEAFIGSRHVVGRVEEKQQARKEYKEAVSKGHGAYLMEEEKPVRVFLVIFNFTMTLLPTSQSRLGMCFQLRTTLL